MTRVKHAREHWLASEMGFTGRNPTIEVCVPGPRSGNSNWCIQGVIFVAMGELVNKLKGRYLLVAGLLVCNLFITSHAVSHQADSFENCVICHFQDSSDELVNLVGSNSTFDATNTLPHLLVNSGFTTVVTRATPIRAPPL